MNAGSSEIFRESHSRDRTGPGALVLAISVLVLAIFAGKALGAPAESPSSPQLQPAPTEPAEPASTTREPARPANSSAGNGSGGVAPGAGRPPAPEGDRAPAFTEQEPTDSGGMTPDDSGTTDDPLAVDPDSVPNFVIDEFEIPPFLLPIYQACGSEYGIPWQILAAINRIETAFGTNLSVSYAGAMGWMQFMPGTWEAYGVDANGDRQRDPYNPVDAICSAANYLEASGYAEDPSQAIFAYNHADWYVEDILTNARAYSEIPSELITALTGLTEGARFPVAGEATYEGQVSTESGTGQAGGLDSSSGRSSVRIQAAGGTPVIAVNDGVIKEINSAAGTVALEDAYGNRYTYAGLGSIAQVHPVPRQDDAGTADTRLASSSGDQALPDADMGEEKSQDRPVGAPAGEAPEDLEPAREPGDMEISEVQVDSNPAEAPRASDSENLDPGADADPVNTGALAAATERRAAQEEVSTASPSDGSEQVADSQDMRGRVYAEPLRPSNQKRATVDGQSVNNGTPAVQYTNGVAGKPGDYVIYDGSKSGVYRFDQDEAELLPLRKGSRVIAGTILGRLAETAGAAIDFSIRPGGEGAVKIDPKPFLDGWRLLAETNIYSAKGRNRFAGRLGAGGVLLLSKSALQRRVLADPKISIHECGKTDIAVGAIDRRVLAVLAYLSAKGYSLMITSLYCGREASITTSGYVSNHSRGQAVDIAAINGEVITSATQGPGSLTDRVAREVLALQGTMAPDEVITLLDYPQPAGFAMGDHDDHIHIGYSSTDESDLGGYIAANLGAEQWRRLTRRLGQIRNPLVPDRTSPSALPEAAGGQGR